MTKDTSTLPIGVFDSGVGGLTVLRALQEKLPHEDFIYLGDTARLPYGTKSRASVERYALQCAEALIQHGIKMLVVACNTATAAALPALREKHPNLPVIGVVRPGARAGCGITQTHRIAVAATEGTVKGGSYQQAILDLCPEAKIIAQPCPLFVALAEEGWTEGPLVEGIIARYLDPIFQNGPQSPDVLVLGCTHFPVLAQAIRNVLGPGVSVIDSAETTATDVALRLQGSDRIAKEANQGTATFLATDSPERFARVGSIFLGRAIRDDDVRIVDL